LVVRRWSLAQAALAAFFVWFSCALGIQLATNLSSKLWDGDADLESPCVVPLLCGLGQWEMFTMARRRVHVGSIRFGKNLSYKLWTQGRYLCPANTRAGAPAPHVLGGGVGNWI
jgi:hypothetical protein